VPADVSNDRLTDSLLKLDAYQAALDSLATAAKPKVTASDYETLSAARQLASDCLTAQLPAG
jgi:hypothetical protein